MAIRGIGSYGMSSYFNYQSTINQMRLRSALSKNTRYQQAVQPVHSVNSVSISDGSSSIDFLTSYNSAMSDLMQSSNTLREINRSGVMNEMEVTSSDTSIAEAQERYTIRSGKELTVDVAQIATSQENLSSGAVSTAKADSGMNFTIADSVGKTVDITISQNYDNGNQKTNHQMLKEAAAQINSQTDVKVKAYVEEKDGISTLRLKGTETGQNNTFSVTGTLGAAAGAENVSKASQDAVYTVTSDGQTFNRRSSANDVTVDYGRIGMKLKSAGTVTVSAQADNEKIISAVEDLTHSYNNALKLLNDNAGRGTGVINQLSSFVRGLASEKSLNGAGISTNKDGTLKLDKDALRDNLKKDPQFTKELLGGNYSVAQTVFTKAAQALKTNAGSLIGNDLKEMQYQSDNDPFNFMYMYSRNGAYNMNNYNALGLMINYLV